MCFALQNVQSQHRAHNFEQQGMWMTLRVTCWELENASRTDGDRQQLPAFTELTLPGVGRREPRENWHIHECGEPRQRKGPKRQGRQRQSRENNQRRSETRCKWKSKRILGQA